MVEKIKIINSFGLQVEEVEPLVLRVLNTDTYVDYRALQMALGVCGTFTSDTHKYDKLKGGVYSKLSKVYYILLKCSDLELIDKYDDIASKDYGVVIYTGYNASNHITGKSGIDTIYSASELGR